MTLATSKNLTVVGIAGIVAAVAQAVALLFDGDPATNPDWTALIALVWAGVTAILAKGAQSTGGTVATTPEAAIRVGGGT
jgi:hypothetical protein